MASKPSAPPSGQPATTLSTWQKLDLLPAVLQILMGTVGTALLAPFRGQHAPKTFKRHVMIALGRHLTGRLSSQQMQWMGGTTGSSYAAWTKKEGLQPASIVIPKAQTSAFWVGDPNADTVGLYFHGGGWAVPGGEGHFKYLSQINAAASASGKSLAFLVLQYDLAPAQQYPRQLKQCVELLRYAVTELKRSPKQLMLGGDSAGGNLVFGVLLHLLHSHPEIERLQLTEPLKAAFTASPWVDFDMSSERFRGSDVYDAAPVSTLKTWARNYIGSSKSDEWLEPAKAEAEKWQGVEKVVENILITIAKEEVMADDVKRMAARIESAHAKLKLFAAPEDFHAEPAIGANMGFEMGDAAKVIQSWVADRS